MSFKKLNPQQQKDYASAVRRLGLPETESTHRPLEHPAGKTIVYSSDPLESDVPPKLVTVNTIQEMKKMLGLDLLEASSEEEIPYPESKPEKNFFALVNKAQSKEELEASLNDAEKENISKAAYAYLHGNAKKLKHYVPLINKLHFPTQLAVFAATDPKVVDGTVVITSDDGKAVTWIYPAVILGTEGQIDQQADFLLQTGSLSSSEGASGNIVINDVPADYPNPAAGGTSPGQPGQATGGAVFTSPTPKIINGTVVITSPDGTLVKWCYPSVTMGPNGLIDQQADFLLQTSILNSSEGESGSIVITDFPPDYKNPATGGSSPGQPGQAGGGQGGTLVNSPVGNCEPVCAVPPTAGDNGTAGSNGGNGSPGQVGGSMYSLTVTATESLTEIIEITAGGGNGQDGGLGGNGAPGGLGGPGGNGPLPCGTAANGVPREQAETAELAVMLAMAAQ